MELRRGTSCSARKRAPFFFVTRHHPMGGRTAWSNCARNFCKSAGIFLRQRAPERFGIEQPGWLE